MANTVTASLGTQIWVRVRNSIKGSEKEIERKLRRIRHRYFGIGLDMKSVEDFLYQNVELKTYIKSDHILEKGFYKNLLETYVRRLTRDPDIREQVELLYWPYIERQYSKPYFTFDERDINILKELTWVIMYLVNRNLGKVESQKDLIMKLVDCGDYYILASNENIDTILRKIVINICSYKNADYELMQYPGWVSLSDLEEFRHFNRAFVPTNHEVTNQMLFDDRSITVRKIASAFSLGINNFPN